MFREGIASLGGEWISTVVLKKASDQRSMDLWNKMTVFDPITEKEIHKATIMKLINGGISVGSNSFDQMKKVQNEPNTQQVEMEPQLLSKEHSLSWECWMMKT